MSKTIPKSPVTRRGSKKRRAAAMPGNGRSGRLDPLCRKREAMSAGDGPLREDVTQEIVLSLIRDVLEVIDTPVSLGVAIRLENKMVDEVVSLSIDPANYLDATSFARDYQAVKLVSKADFLPTSFDRKKVALGRFESAEEQCRQTNLRVRAAYVDGRPNKVSPSVDRIIQMTRRKIEHVLGPFPADRLIDACHWGPGATTSIRNPRTSVYEKYREPVTGSGLCLSLFRPLIKEVDLWHRVNLRPAIVVDGNKVVFVPKDAKTDRSIAAEPSFNSYVQLGIGRLMRERLRLKGVDLSSQETNRDLARYGSLTGKVATVDLSMASDTLSKSVCELLVPDDWLLAMKCSRSAGYRTGKELELTQYHKFSSMGNGYTFELETLIFFAVASAIAEDLRLPWWEVMAYGDDITVGTEAVPLLTEVLTFLGFVVNDSKSYSSGCFRESCGKDYFFGDDVRPYFVRSIPRERVKFFAIHNGLRRKLGGIFGPLCDRLVRKHLNSHQRIWGPAQLGDTVLWSRAPRGNFRVASAKYPQFEGFIVRHLVFKPSKTAFDLLEAAVLASLYSKSESPTLGYSTLRKRGNWVTRTTIVPNWDDDDSGSVRT